MSFNISFQGLLSSDGPSGPNGSYKATDISLADLLAFQRLEYLVAEAFDTQNVTSVRHLMAPTLKMDVGSHGIVSHDITLDDWLEEMSKNDLHNKHIKTHHMMGGGYYERLSATEVKGVRQILMTHLVHSDEDHSGVEHSVMTAGAREVTYKKIDGEWKWAGAKVIAHMFGEGYEKLPHAKHLGSDRKEWHKKPNTT